MVPTPLEKKLGIAKRLWTDEELAEQYREHLDLQAQEYDPKWEWEVGGWRMYPNHRGSFLMVISFDKDYKARSSEAFDVDPRPRPWKIGYKKSWDSENSGLIGSFGTENFFETLDQARDQFAKTAMKIEREFRDLGVTEDTPRQAKCASCNKLHDWDSEKKAYFGMWSFVPYRQYDDTYDGCRGWD